MIDVLFQLLARSVIAVLYKYYTRKISFPKLQSITSTRTAWFVSFFDKTLSFTRERGEAFNLDRVARAPHVQFAVLAALFSLQPFPKSEGLYKIEMMSVFFLSQKFTCALEITIAVNVGRFWHWVSTVEGLASVFFVVAQLC